MGRPAVLVTVVRADGSETDLRVAADIGCAELMGPLRLACGVDPSSRDVLHDRDGLPLRPEQTLVDAGVLDGDRLHLTASGTAPAVTPRRPLDQAEAVRRRFGPAAP